MGVWDMGWLTALLLGIVQGVTEFLPVSSSAHLKIVKHLCNIEPEGQVIFDLMCHLGTLAAVLLFFRKDIVHLLFHDRKKLGLLTVALIPLVPCYFLLKPLRDWASQTELLGFCLMATGLILFAGQYFRFNRQCVPSLRREVNDALWIGAMQSAALIPGISRSASTISCARALGWSASEAVRFSFLLSIPTIFGGNVLELAKAAAQHASMPISLSACAIGFGSSCIVGSIVVRFALRLLEKGNLKPFAWYCLAAGLGAIIYLNL